MKTYQDYVKEWENSTESRDLSFEEWLMLQLERKDQHFKEFLDKACEWIRERNSYACKEWLDKECEDFRKAMRAKPESQTNLTWRDMLTIVSIYGYTPRLNDNGELRTQEDFFTEILTKFKTTKQ